MDTLSCACRKTIHVFLSEFLVLHLEVIHTLSMSFSSTKQFLEREVLCPQTLLHDRYRIERKIDEGGMASIYLALDEKTGQKVALKCLYATSKNNPIIRERKIDEGRIQSVLQHPNILRLHELVEQPVHFNLCHQSWLRNMFVCFS